LQRPELNVPQFAGWEGGKRSEPSSLALNLIARRPRFKLQRPELAKEKIL